MVSKMRSSITGYSELENKLKELAKTEASILIKEAEMNKEIISIEAKFNRESKDLREKRNGLQVDIHLFCHENKKDFDGKKKSRKFLYGTVGFRESSKGAIILLNKKIKNGFKQAAILMQSLFQDKYIRMIPELNKELISSDYRENKLTDTLLAAANLKFQKESEFYYKLDFKKLEKEEGIKVPAKIVKNKKEAA